MLCLYNREIRLAQNGCNAQNNLQHLKTNMTKNHDKIMNRDTPSRGGTGSPIVPS